MEGSISDQSSADALSATPISALSSGRAVSSSNSPPLNQSTWLETDKTAPVRHRAKQPRGVVLETRGPLPRLFQHPREHVSGQQAHILGEHAEHQTVDEVRYRLRIVTPIPQALCKLRKGCRRPLRHRLPRLARTQPLRIRHRPFEPIAHRAVGEIVKRELVGHAHAVGPVGADAEPRHVRDDQ